MKSQDIVILLKLILLHQRTEDENLVKNSGHEAFSARGLENSLGISKSEVNASINRSVNAGLIAKDRKNSIPRTNINALLELIIHGIKYVFPVKPGALVRGIPTAAAAPVMQEKLKSMDEHICVWPDPQGDDMGQSLKPLFKSVPYAAQQDPALYDLLALVDAIRLGNPRESKVAQQLLEQRLKT